MKCQILFSGKNKKNIIYLSSAENAQRVVKAKHSLTSAIVYQCSRYQDREKYNGCIFQLVFRFSLESYYWLFF